MFCWSSAHPARTRSRPISSTGSTPWGSALRFRRVVVPTEQVIETKDGQKVQIEKRILPGYVLVNMDLNDEPGPLCEATPRRHGLRRGPGGKPVPLAQSDVDRLLHTGAAAGPTVRARRLEFHPR